MSRPASATGRLADLARAGYAVLRQPSMQVDYEIHHVEDRPGQLLELLARDAEQGGAFAETLSAGAHGVGVVVGTRIGGGTPRGATAGAEVFRGTARPNPTFADEPVERFEGVITVEDEPRGVILPHGLGLRDALQEVSRLALQERESLLSLQCPAQLPPVASRRGSARTVATARSSAHALRFAMSLTRPRADVRLRLADRLAAYCRDRGLGLRLADTRSGYHTGDWFTVQPHQRPVARTRYDPAGHVPTTSVEGCLPVTVVGPARLGATHALIDFLARHPAVGVLSCSMAPLDDLAIIHLQLVVNRASQRRLAGINRDLAGWEAARSPSIVLPRVVTGLLHADPVTRRPEPDWSAVEDYQTVVGPARTVVQNRLWRVPVWFSWRMRKVRPGLRVPIGALTEALGQLGLADGDASIEYLACRLVGTAALSGKGKLAIPKRVLDERYPSTRYQSGPERLCAALEDAWTARLAGDPSGAQVSGLSVSWRESWLGQWT